MKSMNDGERTWCASPLRFLACHGTQVTSALWRASLPTGKQVDTRLALVLFAFLGIDQRHDGRKEDQAAQEQIMASAIVLNGVLAVRATFGRGGVRDNGNDLARRANQRTKRTTM